MWKTQKLQAHGLQTVDFPHAELSVYPVGVNAFFGDDFSKSENYVMMLFMCLGLQVDHRIWFCENNRVPHSIPLLISYCCLYPDYVYPYMSMMSPFCCYFFNFSHWIFHGQCKFSWNRHMLETVGYVPGGISKSAIEIMFHFAIGRNWIPQSSFLLIITQTRQQNRCFFLAFPSFLGLN